MKTDTTEKGLKTLIMSHVVSTGQEIALMHAYSGLLPGQRGEKMLVEEFGTGAKKAS